MAVEVKIRMSKGIERMQYTALTDETISQLLYSSPTILPLTLSFPSTASLYYFFPPTHCLLIHHEQCHP